MDPAAVGEVGALAAAAGAAVTAATQAPKKRLSFCQRRRLVGGAQFFWLLWPWRLRLGRQRTNPSQHEHPSEEPQSERGCSMPDQSQRVRNHGVASPPRIAGLSFFPWDGVAYWTCQRVNTVFSLPDWASSC